MITDFEPRVGTLPRGISSRGALITLLTVACCSAVGTNLNAQTRAPGGATVAVEQEVEQGKTQNPSTNGEDNAIITLSVKDRTLSSVLQTIARQARHPVVFDYTDSLLSKLVTVHIVKKSVRDAIQIALAGTGLTSVMAPDGETIVIRRRTQKTDTLTRDQATGAIHGRVIDSATQQGVVEATITLIGTKFSTLTGTDGSFKLVGVPVGQYTVSVRLIGYKSYQQKVEVNTGKPSVLSIKISGSARSLSEVVTTVTGRQRKIEIGNDITTLDVPQILKQAPINSVTDLLEGRVPGLTVMRTSGVPGAPARLRLRGLGGGLLSNVPGAPTNDPIVIVDGIRIYAGQSGVDDQKLGGGQYPTPSPIDQIDPNSVEKIEVLRGPSAAAMYGSDAANGVIVITTKKGAAGSARWDVIASGGIEEMPGIYAQPGYYRFGHRLGGSFDNAIQTYCPSIGGLGSRSGSGEYFSCIVDSLVRFQALNEPRLSMIGRGTNMKLSGTASGGTNQFTYSVTGSLANTLGLTKMPPLYQDLFQQLYDTAPSRRMRRPNTLGTKSGQATFSTTLTDGLTATYTTSLSHSEQRQSSANLQLSALASMYLDTTNIHPGEVGQYAYQFETNTVTANHALALNLLRWAAFPVTATVGLNRVDRGAEGLAPRGIVVITEHTAFGEILSEQSKGEFTERREQLSTSTARANGTLFPRARTSVSMGAEVTRRSNTFIAAYSDTLIEGVSRPSTLIGGTRAGRSTTTGGWFVEPRLNLNSRFFVNPGFRFDGGGGTGARGGFRGGLWSLFPKLNFSWIAIDREGREPLWGIVSLLRPRFAVGVAGVQPASEWSLRTLEQDVGTWDPAIVGAADSIAPDLGLRLRSVGNTKLGPERSQEFEGGFDLQLWNTRITLAATGFYKMRKDAIQRLPLAPSVGAPQSYYANIGHVRNTGGEFTLNAWILDLPTIGWNVDVSVSKYANKLTKLYGDRTVIDLGNGTRLVEGYPLFGRWSRPITGWTNPRGGERLWYSDFVVGDSAVYMGMQAPDFEMPFSTTLTLFRGLMRVNALFDYKAGLTQFNVGSQNRLSNIYDNPASTFLDQAYALAAVCFELGMNPGARRSCTDYGFIQTVNTLRFNSMSIGVNVPHSYLKRLPFSTMSVSLQGSNLGVWTNYRGKDPDVNGSLVGDATSDSGQLPMPRSWSLRIQLGK